MDASTLKLIPEISLRAKTADVHHALKPEIVASLVLSPAEGAYALSLRLTNTKDKELEINFGDPVTVAHIQDLPQVSSISVHTILRLSSESEGLSPEDIFRGAIALGISELASVTFAQHENDVLFEIRFGSYTSSASVHRCDVPAWAFERD